MAHRVKHAKPMFKYDMLMVWTHAEHMFLHVFYCIMSDVHAPVDPGRASLVLRLLCAM